MNLLRANINLASRFQGMETGFTIIKVWTNDTQKLWKFEKKMAKDSIVAPLHDCGSL